MQMLDKRARALHIKPTPENPGTKHLVKYEWANCRYAAAMRPGYEHFEIPENSDERELVPDDVFCLTDVASWRCRIWRLLDDLVTEKVKQSFRRNPPEYVVSDDLSWLNGIVLERTGREIDMKSILAERIAQEYRSFRAGHGTRTNNLGQFYKDGIRYLRPHEIEASARALFLTSDFDWVTEEKLQIAIADIDARNTSGGRAGRLYFCADERSLITRLGGAGHYLVYGSEYLSCLGVRLIGSLDTKNVLKSVGRPTMFVCDIPMKMMREHALGEFAGMVLEILFCELIGEPSDALSPGAGTALSLTEDLPGVHIVGHYHPAAIHDPL